MHLEFVFTFLSCVCLAEPELNNLQCFIEEVLKNIECTTGLDTTKTELDYMCSFNYEPFEKCKTTTYLVAALLLQLVLVTCVHVLLPGYGSNIGIPRKYYSPDSTTKIKVTIRVVTRVKKQQQQKSYYISANPNGTITYLRNKANALNDWECCTSTKFSSILLTLSASSQFH